MNKFEEKKSLIHLGILCVVSFVLKNILTLIFQKTGFFNTTYLILISNGLITVLAVFMPFIVGKYFFGLLSAKKQDTNKFKIKFKTSILITLFSFGLCMFLNFVTAFISMLCFKQGFENTTSVYENDVWTISLMVVVLAVIPAICEEIVFREIVISAFQQYGNKFAIYISALSFGILHNSLSSIFFAICLGAVFAFLRIITNSVIPSMTVHFLNNVLGVLTIILPTIMSQQDYNIMYFIIIGLSAVLTVLGIIFIILKRKSFIQQN